MKQVSIETIRKAMSKWAADSYDNPEDYADVEDMSREEWIEETVQTLEDYKNGRIKTTKDTRTTESRSKRRLPWYHIGNRHDGRCRIYHLFGRSS